MARSKQTYRVNRRLAEQLEAIADEGRYASVAELTRTGIRRLVDLEDTGGELPRDPGLCGSTSKQDRRTVRLSDWMIEQLERLADVGGYESTSAVLRAAAFEMLRVESPSRAKALISDHAEPDEVIVA